MKNEEFYKRVKIKVEQKQIFDANHWWLLILMLVAAVVIAPLTTLKHRRVIPITIDFYIHQIILFSPFVFSFGGIVLWFSFFREQIKKKKGYDCLGKFKVVAKRISFGSCYLKLAPGNSNEVKIERTLYQKTRLGDLLLIRRNALGDIMEINRVSNIQGRVKKIF